MRVLSIVGARPQFVKLAPIVQACKKSEVHHEILHTGQHFDSDMSSDFFSEFDLPAPNVQLHAGGGTNVEQVAKISSALERHFNAVSYDAVLVYGDTNTTLAASIVVPRTSMLLAHVEAGLRSGNLRMPEELNRILTDHVSDLLFAPTHLAAENLIHEGLGDRSHFVGDVMYDVFKSRYLTATKRNQLHFDLPSSFYLATLHRAANVDNTSRLVSILTALNSLDLPVVLVTHPRLAKAFSLNAIQKNFKNITSIAPLGHKEMIDTLMRSDAVITDSGGLQKEAYFSKTKCVTLRDETEWPETLEGGCNILTSPDSLSRDIQTKATFSGTGDPFGNGSAAVKIIEILLRELNH
jgi:UDP-N-acetylglucosamine 2-epimerase (non-hydrolysing)